MLWDRTYGFSSLSEKWNDLKSFRLHEKRVHPPRDIFQWHSNVWPPFHCFRTWICMMTAVKSYHWKRLYVILFGFEYIEPFYSAAHVNQLELKKVSNKERSSQLWTQFMQLRRKPGNPEPVKPEAWIRELPIPVRRSNRCSESLLRKRRV